MIAALLAAAAVSTAGLEHLLPIAPHSRNVEHIPLDHPCVVVDAPRGVIVGTWAGPTDEAGTVTPVELPDADGHLCLQDGNLGAWNVTARPGMVKVYADPAGEAGALSDTYPHLISGGMGSTTAWGGGVDSTVALDATAAVLMAAPPCGTPEAAKADHCIRWTVRPDAPNAIGQVGGPVSMGVPSEPPR